MTSLQALSSAALEAYADAVRCIDVHRAIRLKRIVLAIDRELDGTAHHPNCECNRCYSNMGGDA